jgi:hypothetical protein
MSPATISEIVVQKAPEQCAPPTTIMEVITEVEPEHQISPALSNTLYSNLQIETEIMVCCPKCKTLETVYFSRGQVMPTQKFHQQNQKLYHDCGSTIPCKLFHYGW